REKLVETLIGIGCAADTNPFVVRGLIEQLDDRFGNTPIKLLMHLEGHLAEEAAVASAFLDETKCSGTPKLSDQNKATLMRIVDRAAAADQGGSGRRNR